MRKYIQFKGKEMFQSEFAHLLRDMTNGEITACTCTCHYKQAHRLILKGYGHRLTYYLTYDVAKNMTPEDCVRNLVDTCKREWRISEVKINE